MHLTEPFTPAFNNLALFAAAILPKAQVEAKGAAFFDAWWAPALRAEEMDARRLARAGEEPLLLAGRQACRRRAVLEVVTEPSARVIKLEAGEVDVALGPSWRTSLPHWKAEPGITTGSVTPYRADFVQPNTRYAPLGNEKVKCQALNYADVPSTRPR